MVKAASRPSTPDAPSQEGPQLNQQSFVLNVGGMKCAGCVRAVEKQLAANEGVTSATVNLVTEVAVVETASDLDVDPQVLADRLTQAGFPSQARAVGEGGSPSALSDWLEQGQQAQRSHLRRLGIALVLLGLSTVGHLKHLGWVSIPVLSSLWFHFGLATATLMGPARDILWDGWQGIRRGTPTMNTLVALGTLSAYGASVVALGWPSLGWECFFDEPVMLLSFILLGRTLEQRARFRAANALRSLVALQPAKARLIVSNDPEALQQPGIEVPVEVVQPGEWLRVLPGETIPADGVIEAGQTTVDESMLTGESVPVAKQPGGSVSAGSLNLSGAITLQVSHGAGDTVLAQMIRLVESAQTRKAPAQRLADQVAGYFTYGVLAIAVTTFLFWNFIGLSLWPEVMSTALGPMHVGHTMTAESSVLLISLKRAIAVLVIACPCALGLATPTAILVGSGLGAERGLLVRGGDVLEVLSRVDTVVFDKTGTLTQGSPTLLGCRSFEAAYSEADILTLSAAVEGGTQHPLAIAIQRAAPTSNLPLAQDFETLTGSGVAATVTWQHQPQRVRLGSKAWLQQEGIAFPATPQAATAPAQDRTAVYVVIANQVIGLLEIADALRPEAANAVAALKGRGLAVHLLTGDRPSVAAAVAADVGIPAANVQAQMLPADKVQAITTLQNQGHCVALVGDGINDAPALAEADVGLSLSSSTDIAAEAADVVLMKNSLSAVEEALNLGRATVAKIQQNLVWAFAYNLIGIPLAAGVLLPAYHISLSPAVAGGLMAFSSVTVVVNSLLLKARSIEAT